MLRNYIKSYALRWANRQRERMGRAPLPELLTGTKRVPGSCPVANTIGTGTMIEVRRWRVGPTLRWRRLPIRLRFFELWFDQGRYPDLVAPASPAFMRRPSKAPAPAAALPAALDPVGSAWTPEGQRFDHTYTPDELYAALADTVAR